MRNFGFVFGAVAIAVAMFACGDDDSTPGAGASSSSSSGGTSGTSGATGTSGSTGTSSGGTSSGGTSSGGTSGNDAGPTSGALHITERGNAHTLDNTVSAQETPQGFIIKAASDPNASPAHAVTIILRRRVRKDSGSTATLGATVAGKYDCTDADPDVGKDVLSVNNMGYTLYPKSVLGGEFAPFASDATGKTKYVCSVNLTTLDAPGGHVKGTFTATMQPNGINKAPDNVDLDGTTGDFDIVRGADATN